MDLLSFSGITAAQAEACAELPSLSFDSTQGEWLSPELVPIVAPVKVSVSDVVLDVEKEVIDVDVPSTLLIPMSASQSYELFCQPLYLRDVLPLIVRYAVANGDSSAMSLLSVNKALYQLWTRDSYISSPLLPGKLMMKHQWDMHDWIVRLSRRDSYPLKEFMPRLYRPGVSQKQFKLIKHDVDMSAYWKPTFVISAPTGTGKTVAIFSSALAMAAADEQKRPFLIVSPPTVAYTVYQDLYRELFGPDDSIVVLYGKIDPKLDLRRYRFIIVSSYTIGRKTKRLAELVASVGSFRCVYVDEYDCAIGMEGAQFLNAIDTPMRIMLSANKTNNKIYQRDTSLFGFTEHEATAASMLNANHEYTLTVNGNHMKAVTQYTRYSYGATGVYYSDRFVQSNVLYNRHCGMGAELIKLLQSHQRLVLYCSSVEILEGVTTFINAVLPYLTLYIIKGSSQVYRNRMANFLGGAAGIMITTMNAASRGVNMHRVVDTVVMIGCKLSIMAYEEQCSGRLMRIGRQKPCELHVFELPDHSDIILMKNAHEYSGDHYWSPYALAHVAHSRYYGLVPAEMDKDIITWGWSQHVISLIPLHGLAAILVMILDGHITVEDAARYKQHFKIVRIIKDPILIRFMEAYPQHRDVVEIVFG